MVYTVLTTWLALALSALIVGILYLKLNPQFGGNITSERGKLYRLSPNWKGKTFKNLSYTAIDIPPSKMPGLIKAQLTNTEIRRPSKPIPILPLDVQTFEANKTTPNSPPKFVWYGHSVLLLQIHGQNLLIDPMLGPNTTPIAPIANKRFSPNSLDVIDQLPPIDAILLTHDHYDHLDLASIRKLKDKVNKYFVSLGTGRHLERWGIPKEQITEFDWWDQTNFNGIDITFTPSRHFSGRGLTDRFKTLWGGWVFQSPHHQIYWTGDGGYDTHFKEVGQRFGKFDWAFVECGQYNKLWPQTHMFPEESAQSATDANASIAIPVHWGGFALALHTWKDPIERFTTKAKELNLTYCTPQIGEVVVMGQEPKEQAWYDNF